jgi:transposase
MQVIGEETSERLDVIPAQYRVIVTHRPRLACRACERIVQAPAPEHLIKSGLPTETMVASVLVAKYGWHLPLYRQAKMLAAQGLDLDRSTNALLLGFDTEARAALLGGRNADVADGWSHSGFPETPGLPHQCRPGNCSGHSDSTFWKACFTAILSPTKTNRSQPWGWISREALSRPV